MSDDEEGSVTSGAEGRIATTSVSLAACFSAPATAPGEPPPPPLPDPIAQLMVVTSSVVSGEEEEVGGECGAVGFEEMKIGVGDVCPSLDDKRVVK